MRYLALLSFLSLAFLSVGCTGCTETVNPGEVGVAVSWGQTQSWVYPEGFHWTDPFGMNVVHMSTRTQAYEMGSSGTPQAQEGQAESAVERGEPVEVLAQDQLAVTLSCTVQFHLSASDAPAIYRSYGEAYADTIIHPIVRTAVRDAASEFRAMQLIDQRPQLQTRMESLVLERLHAALTSRQIPEDAVIVDNILLQSIDLPETIVTAIAAVQEQQQQTSRRQQELLTAQAEAERAQAEARGVAEQARIRAQGDADALRIRSQADADAARLMTAALSPAVLEGRRIDAFRAVLQSSQTRTVFVPTSMSSVRLVMPTDGGGGSAPAPSSPPPTTDAHATSPTHATSTPAHPTTP